MTLQLPISSVKQQDSNVRVLQRRQIIPYTFQVNETFTTVNFPNLSNGIRYKTLVWTPPTTLFLTQFRFNGDVIPGTNTPFNAPSYYTFCQVNLVNTIYSTTITGGGNVYQDIGNCLFSSYAFIYGILSQQPGPVYLSSDLRGYEDITKMYPHGYYVQANTPIYIQMGMSDVTGNNTDSVSVQSIIIDAIVTQYSV